MRIRLLLLLFCVFVVAGKVSAQKRSWTEVPVGTSITGTWYIDFSSVRRLSSGNVTYWSKGAGKITLIEVNCVAKESRRLKVIKHASTDSYGNQTNGDVDVTNEFGTGWTRAVPTSISNEMNGMACREAKDVAPQSSSPTAKKKIVKKVVKRKP
jgi:hypothetical protein